MLILEIFTERMDKKLLKSNHSTSSCSDMVPKRWKSRPEQQKVKHHTVKTKGGQ